MELATFVFLVVIQASNIILIEKLLGINEYRKISSQAVNNRLCSFAVAHAEMRDEITATSGLNF
jgi:hypothetical protein